MFYRKTIKAIVLLLPLLAANFSALAQNNKLAFSHGAIVRGDSTKKEIALVFTADEFGEGLPDILRTLKKEKVQAGFFFTGRFYRNVSFRKAIARANKDGHYLGPHSDNHLLYCDWTKRDSLLVSKDSFLIDLRKNFTAMKALPLPVRSPHLFIPPFEWWNDSVAAWSKEASLLLFNFTPGMRTNADYTWPELGTSYKSSDWIMAWLKETIASKPASLNGAVILIHAGTDPRRKDKFYKRLAEAIAYLKASGFRFKRIDALLMR